MLSLKIMGGKIQPLIEVETWKSIYDLKEEIIKKLGVDVERQILYYNTRELKNHEFLEAFSFHESEKVNLIVRPLAGHPKQNVLIIEQRGGINGYVRVRETDTVYDLRRKVEKHWGIPQKRIILPRLNKEMKDDDPLYA